MLSSIGKFSKSLSIKVLVWIIILPFIFWGMGDIFRGGNQNIIATIDSEKISTQEFFNYLNRLNLKLKGSELISVMDVEKGINPSDIIKLEIKYISGEIKIIETLCRIDTKNELEYYKNGGILQYVLRNMI